MTPEAYAMARKLEKLGLVRFVLRVNRKGDPQGHDVELTANGKSTLKAQAAPVR